MQTFVSFSASPEAVPFPFVEKSDVFRTACDALRRGCWKSSGVTFTAAASKRRGARLRNCGLLPMSSEFVRQFWMHGLMGFALKWMVCLREAPAGRRSVSRFSTLLADRGRVSPRSSRLGRYSFGGLRFACLNNLYRSRSCCWIWSLILRERFARPKHLGRRSGPTQSCSGRPRNGSSFLHSRGIGLWLVACGWLYL